MEKEVNKILIEKIAPDEIKYEGNVFLPDGNKSGFVKMRTVIYIEAAKDYTKIFTSDSKSFLVRKAIKQWDEKLPGHHFIRIHRSFIINTDYIRKVEKSNNHSHKLYLEGVKEPFIISKSYSKTLENLIKDM